jgi:hypothetical protein
MLEVGNKGLTIAEQRTHFALWAMGKSPLLIGSDVRSINASSLEILKNKVRKKRPFFSQFPSERTMTYPDRLRANAKRISPNREGTFRTNRI